MLRCSTCMHVCMHFFFAAIYIHIEKYTFAINCSICMHVCMHKFSCSAEFCVSHCNAVDPLCSSFVAAAALLLLMLLLCCTSFCFPAAFPAALIGQRACGGLFFEDKLSSIWTEASASTGELWGPDLLLVLPSYLLLFCCACLLNPSRRAEGPQRAPAGQKGGPKGGSTGPQGASGGPTGPHGAPGDLKRPQGALGAPERPPAAQC